MSNYRWIEFGNFNSTREFRVVNETCYRPKTLSTCEWRSHRVGTFAFIPWYTQGLTNLGERAQASVEMDKQKICLVCPFNLKAHLASISAANFTGHNVRHRMSVAMQTLLHITFFPVITGIENMWSTNWWPLSIWCEWKQASMSVWLCACVMCILSLSHENESCACSMYYVLVNLHLSTHSRV